MIVTGAIILYVTVILFGVDENITSDSTVNGLCQARVWLCVIGFSLLFGTILAKAWRIYYVFKHSKPNSDMVSENVIIPHNLEMLFAQEITDLYLFLIVGVQIVIDIVFMIPPTAVDDTRLQRRQKEINADDNVSYT